MLSNCGGNNMGGDIGVFSYKKSNGYEFHCREKLGDPAEQAGPGE